MRRRDFLKHALGAGMGLTLFPSRALAVEPGVAEGPYWLFVHASGGWDPTMLCDPKGRVDELEEDPVNHYFVDEIGTAGNLTYAPGGYNETFFQKHYQRMLVINGLDTGTNSHTVGTRNMWSGKLAEGYPSLAALVAASSAPDVPMSYVSFGGYDFTAGTVAPTRLGNLGLIRRIAHPNRINDEPDETFHSEATMARILEAQRGRRDYLKSRPLLPKARRSVERLFAARTGDAAIESLLKHLPEDVADDDLKRQAQLAMVAFKSGLAKTANLTRGGFDTHGDHDNRQGQRLAQLLEGIDFAFDEADRLGIADQLVVVIGSDFARTPRYNSGNGKDHWSISSAIVMGHGIKGNRVVGATTHRQEAKKVDPQTLELSDKGITLECTHLHRALRTRAGLDTHDLGQRDFPLPEVENLPLL